MNIYEVQVETYDAKYTHKIFGLDEAVAICAEAGSCDNVRTAVVLDCETGEVMFHIDDGVVIWVSGIGNPLEVPPREVSPMEMEIARITSELADIASVSMTGKTIAERVYEAIFGDE